MSLKKQIDGLNELYRKQPTKAGRRVIRNLLRMPCNNWQPWARRDYLSERQETSQRIAELQEDGIISVVSGGRDCDGYQVDNDVYEISASVMALELWLRAFVDGADGPCWSYLARPSEVKDLEQTHRDIFAEAAGY